VALAKKGVVLGPYRLTRRLATGGMAEIFLAQRDGKEGFARELVVKRILPHLAADAEFRRMFRDEARLAALLSHPNVVHVYDFGSIETPDGEDLYLAMELVRGVDLRALVSRAAEEARGVGRPWAIPPHHAAKIASFVCEALAHAHGVTLEGHPARIVHRDVTPSNVLMSFEGAVKLADFGIAKAAQRGGESTDHGVVKGKYTYLSPEQARGETLDGRSDLFNVGILLVEMLLGEPLFAPDQHKEAKRLSAAGQIPRSERLGRLPPPLAAIARKALSARREDRHPDALALRAELEAWLRTSPIPSDTVELGRFVRGLFPDAVAEDAKGARAAGTVPRTMALPPVSALAAVGTAPLTGPGGAPGLPRDGTVIGPSGAFDRMQTTPLTAVRVGRPALGRAAVAGLTGFAGLAALAAFYLALGSGPPEAPPTAPPPSRAAPLAARAPLAPAVLRITSDPAGLRVHLDGAELGRAPLVASTSAGVRHVVDVRDEGGAVLASRELVAEAGSTIDLGLEVEVVQATVRVASRPEGALVRIDEVEIGRTPIEAAVGPGEHAVRLTLPGYREESELVRIERAGETEALTFALLPLAEERAEPRRSEPVGRRREPAGSAERATGLLVIATVPTWSNVYEGSRTLGVTPLRTALPVGHHRLTLRSDEHGSRTVEVDIREGETTRLRVEL
jgi:tRNA A-37 threonylcarbamoyl transferase component Bud32